MQQRYWLMKTEPETFSIQDLENKTDQTDSWEGVRNYQARNFLRDEIRKGDRVLLYHSGKIPSVVGTAVVVRSGYPDPTAWDPASRSFDPKSTPDHPIWYRVDIRLASIFPKPLTLAELRAWPPLKDMWLLRKGMRLSVQPVTEEEYRFILAMSDQVPKG